MKTINYCGELYHVPEWANYVTSDDSGFIAWSGEPNWDAEIKLYFDEKSYFRIFMYIDASHPVTGKMKV